jgi:hypothetical protein
LIENSVFIDLYSAVKIRAQDDSGYIDDKNDSFFGFLFRDKTSEL